MDSCGLGWGSDFRGREKPAECSVCWCEAETCERADFVRDGCDVRMAAKQDLVATNLTFFFPLLLHIGVRRIVGIIICSTVIESLKLQ